ncbi:class E sortase [Rothia sp. P5766]|uniref:class E sortase n=1 Tax=unclassified Rothia (in: high G+C Gram-positive bacteria) TaxID=2689056 RepID=UPI003AE53EC4
MTSKSAPQTSPRPQAAAQGTPLQLTLSVVGELLITLGLILLLFVAWQLWWTNLAANRIQGDTVQGLIQEFNPTTTPDSAKTAEIPAYDPANPTLTLSPSYGQAYGVVYIPRLGADYTRPLAEGVGSDVLDTLGLGHYPESQALGAYGNFALAGHRQTNGAVLDHIDQLQTGDNIYIRTAEGYYTYRVYQSQIVLPSQVEVIAPNPDQLEAPVEEATRRLLTLTSCHPRYGSTERYIVHAEFVSWQPNQAGPPAEIASVAGS